MDRADRLRLIARTCYYLGWLAAVLAVVVRMTKLEAALARVTSITSRNLLEITVLLLLLCLASEARAIGLASVMKLVKGQAA